MLVATPRRGCVGVGLSPLVGRQRELTALLEAVASAGNALLSGPAGVGKTRLLAEFANQLPPSMPHLAISGSEAAASIPLAPLYQFVPPGSPEPARAILTEFYRRSQDSPIVLLVDDAHALDEASAALVHQLCRAEGVPVVAAVRTGETAPEQIDAIWRDGLAVDVALAPLERAASDDLVSELIGVATPGLLEQVWDRCRGHPLFVRELVDSARRTGAVTLVDEAWDIVGDLAIPERLQDLLLRRLAALSSDERRLLALVALSGGLHVDAVDALDLTGESRSLRHGALLTLDGPIVRATHPLHGELLLAEVSTRRKNAIRVELADALEAVGGSTAVQVALLRLDAGTNPRPDELTHALRAAVDARQPKLAGRLVASLGDGPHDAATERLLMHVAAMRGRWDEAEVAFKRASAGVEGATRQAVIAEWGILNFEFRADPAAAVTWASEALASPDILPETAEQLELSALRGTLFSDTMTQAVTDAEGFLKQPRSAEATQLARLALGTALSHLGPMARACAMVEAGLRDAAGVLPPIELVRLHAAFVMASAWRDGPSVAADRSVGALHRARAAGEPEHELLARITLAVALHDGGRHGEAADVMGRAQALSAFLVYRRTLALVDGVHAAAASMLPSRADEAEAVLRSAPRPWETTHWIDGPLLWLARARLDHHQGRSPDPALDAGLEHARRRACGVHELQLLRERAHHGRAQEVAPRVTELVAVSETPLATIIGNEVRALAEADGHALHAAALDAARFGATGIALDAAVAAAEVHTGRDDHAAAARSMALVRWARARLPGQRPCGRHEVRPMLTDRERAVTDRVVAGSSNTDVAHELHLSVRTVERHLYRVFRRLRIGSREELRDLLRSDSDDLPASTQIEV
jgi:DNA-binding CsgD family transcriptional regulator